MLLTCSKRFRETGREMSEELVNAMEERGLDADGLAAYLADGRDSGKACRDV
jgi:hypothetical protein